MGNVLCNIGVTYFCECGNANCKFGEMCHKNKCVVKCKPGEDFANGICVNRESVKTENQCIANIECTSGRCINSIFQENLTTPKVTSHKLSMRPQETSPTKSPKPEAKKESGSKCSSFNECLSGICEKNICQKNEVVDITIIPDQLNTEDTCKEKETWDSTSKRCITDEEKSCTFNINNVWKDGVCMTIEEECQLKNKVWYTNLQDKTQSCLSKEEIYNLPENKGKIWSSSIQQCIHESEECEREGMIGIGIITLVLVTMKSINANHKNIWCGRSFHT